MKTRYYAALMLALGLAIFGAAGAEAGQPFNYTDQTRMYCPPGGRMYFGIFGYWCEDSTLSGVAPIDCKVGPGQPVGTWSNSPANPDELCRKGVIPPQSTTTTSN